MIKTASDLVRKMESDYVGGTTHISKYVDFNLLENINKVEAYSNSKHLTGDKDSKGRDKPFADITSSVVNAWYRATDIDRKDIVLRASSIKDTTKVFIGNIKVQEWMRKENFAGFLNKWGRTLAKQGSALLKFVEKDGKLFASVLNWNNFIIDAVNFNDNPVIEILEYTPATLLQQKGYDKEMVEKLINATTERETSEGMDKDNKADYIKVYEIHGKMPKSFLTGKEEDKDEYIQQMQVVSFIESKEKGEFDDYTLASGREMKDPYMLTHLIEEDNRTKSIGAVERMFEAQWMKNHTAKQVKDHLDLASKLIFGTSDVNFTGQNASTDIDTGDILVHKLGEPLTQVNNTSHDITTLMNYGNEWKAIGNEGAGVSEAMLGETAKSGTAWRQTEALLQENHSLFEVMTENKGIHIQEMFQDYILPYIKKQLKNKDEILAVLEDHQVKQIDAKYIKVESEKRIKADTKKSLLRGELPVSIDVDKTQQDIQSELQEMGNMRSFVPDDITDMEWDEYFKEFEWDVEVDVTGEGSNNQMKITTLVNVLNTVASNPAILQDPNAKMLFNKILSITQAVSPLEIQTAQAQQTPVTPEMPESPEAIGQGGVPTGENQQTTQLTA